MREWSVKQVGYLTVEKLNKQATLPEKAHSGDLGYDLFSSEVRVIQPGDRVLVGTGIRVKFPVGYGGQYFDRSGNAYKKGMVVLAGTIDNGYRGELKVLIYNANKDTLVHISVGDKIAQMVPIEVMDFVVQEGVVDEETVRGANGFGSTDAPKS